MTTPLSTQRRSEEFDELIWQIHGELATTAPSASLAGAPFIDLEPEPEPEPARPRASAASTVSAPVKRRATPPNHHWLASFVAAVLLAFGAGQLAGSDTVVTAMELHDGPEHSAVLAVAHGPATHIPIAPETRADTASPEPPKVTAPEAKPEPKKKKKRTKRRSKPKPKPSVAFEDL